jgi:hypothetical protein
MFQHFLGLANVDELMAELLLPEDAETRSYSRLRTTVTSSIVQSNVTSPTPPSTSPHCQQFLLQQQQPSPIAPVITAGSPQQVLNSKRHFQFYLIFYFSVNCRPNSNLLASDASYAAFAKFIRKFWPEMKKLNKFFGTILPF